MKKRAKKKSTALAKRRREPGKALMVVQQGNTPASATSTMVALAQSKDFDPIKFKALTEFQENMIATQARLNYNRDYFEMQAVLPSISRDGKITIRDKAEKEKGVNARVVQATPYATFPNIMKTVKPILQAHGFTINHTNSTEADGRPTVVSVLAHRDGHYQTSSSTLQLDTTGSKNNVQGFGSAVSYAKRYNTIGLLNLVSHAVEDRDDDGTIAGDAMMAPISAEQLKSIKQLMKETATEPVKFCEFWGLNDVAELAIKNYEAAIRLLNSKSKKVAAS